MTAQNAGAADGQPVRRTGVHALGASQTSAIEASESSDRCYRRVSGMR
jgi:hypothetical protein